MPTDQKVRGSSLFGLSGTSTFTTLNYSCAVAPSSSAHGPRVDFIRPISATPLVSRALNPRTGSSQPSLTSTYVSLLTRFSFTRGRSLDRPWPVLRCAAEALRVGAHITECGVVLRGLLDRGLPGIYFAGDTVFVAIEAGSLVAVIAFVERCHSGVPCCGAVFVIRVCTGW